MSVTTLDKPEIKKNENPQNHLTWLPNPEGHNPFIIAVVL